MSKKEHRGKQPRAGTRTRSPEDGPPSTLPEPTPLEAVERAAADMRRGLPIAVEGDDGLLPVLAAELVDDARLERLAALAQALASGGLATGETGGAGPLGIYLSHERARTLKIRLYTPNVVAVPLGAQTPIARARHLADPTDDLGHPMMGPFEAFRGPLPGAAAAAVALAKLAGLLPAVIAPLVPVPGAADALRARSLLVVSAMDIAQYPSLAAEALRLERVVGAHVPLALPDGSSVLARIVAFRAGTGGPENLAIVIGEPNLDKPVLVRLHSECFTGDLLGSLKCDCGEQLRGAIAAMAKDGAGVLLYLAQEGRGIGLMNKLRAYALQDQGFDTMEANERLGFAADERVFETGAAMLRALGVKSVRLLTNNPDKVKGLDALGITVSERVAHAFPANPHNERYLATKAAKGGHQL